MAREKHAVKYYFIHFQAHQTACRQVMSRWIMVYMSVSGIFMKYIVAVYISSVQRLKGVNCTVDACYYNDAGVRKMS